MPDSSLSAQLPERHTARFDLQGSTAYETNLPRHFGCAALLATRTQAQVSHVLVWARQSLSVLHAMPDEGAVLLEPGGFAPVGGCGVLPAVLAVGGVVVGGGVAPVAGRGALGGPGGTALEVDADGVAVLGGVVAAAGVAGVASVAGVAGIADVAEVAGVAGVLAPGGGGGDTAPGPN